MTDNESRHSRFSWLRLLIAVLGKRAMSCSDEQRHFSNADKGGLQSFPDNFSNVVQTAHQQEKSTDWEKSPHLPSILSPLPLTPIP